MSGSSSSQGAAPASPTKRVRTATKGKGKEKEASPPSDLVDASVDRDLLKSAFDHWEPFSGEGKLEDVVESASEVLSAIDAIALALSSNPFKEDLVAVSFVLNKKFTGKALDWWRLGRDESWKDEEGDLDLDKLKAGFKERFLGEETARECDLAIDSLDLSSSKLEPASLARKMRLLHKHSGRFKRSEERLNRAFVKACLPYGPPGFLAMDWATLVRQTQDGFDLMRDAKATKAKVHVGDVKEAQPAQPSKAKVHVGDGREAQPAQPSSAPQPTSFKGGMTCYYCETKGHGVTSCPLLSCLRCNAKGHLALFCPNKDSKKYSARVLSIPTAVAGSDRVWVEVTLGTQRRAALVDPGAACSVISERALGGVRWRKGVSRWTAIEGLAAGEEVPVVASALVALGIGRKKLSQVEFAVVGADKTSEAVILGADVLGRLGLMDALRGALGALGVTAMSSTDVGARRDAVSAVNAEARGPAGMVDVDDGTETLEAVDRVDLRHLDDVPEERDRLRRVLRRYRGRFVRPGRLPRISRLKPVEFKLTGPPVQEAARPWSPAMEELLRAHEDAFVSSGHAEWVSSASWRAEPHLVPKGDTKVTRYTVDHKGTNRSIAPEAYPMPSMKAQVAKVSGGTVFNKWDFADGFRQIGVADTSQEVTVVRGTRGLLKFRSMPMGLLVSPGVFNERMRSGMLDRMKPETEARTAQYLDDMAQAAMETERSSAVRRAVDMVEEVLAIAEDQGVSFRLGKCRFAEAKVGFCGLTVSKDGKLLRPERAKAVMDFEVETKRDLQALLGLAGDYRQFLERYDLLVFDLHKAVAKKGKLVMTPELRSAIENLKLSCVSALSTVEPDRDKLLTMRVDGSGTGYGGALEQEGRPISFTSRVKRGSEFRYSPFDTEWTAIQAGLEAFEYYLAGHRGGILVITDHKDLEPIAAHAFEDRTGRRARMAEFIRRFPFKLEWRPRSQLAAAHALSMTPAFRAGMREEREKQLELVVGERLAKGSGTADTGGVASVMATAPQALSSWISTQAVQKTAEWWRGKQMAFKPMKEIIDFKEGKEVSGDKRHLVKVAAMAERTVLLEGVLYSIYKAGVREPKDKWRTLLLVPDVEGLRKEWFKRAHGEEGGHRKTNKTYSRLLELVYWDDMFADCDRWVKECAACRATRGGIEGNWGRLQPTTSLTLAGRSRLAMDLLGPLPRTKKGNEFVLVTVNYEDGWQSLSALESQDASAVLMALQKDTLASGGMPEELLTDQGANLLAEVATKMYETLEVERKVAAPQAPWTDGMAEGLVKEVTKMLRAFAYEYKEDWDERLWLVEMILRSADRKPFGMSPFEARFGRKMRLPSWFDLPRREEDSVLVKDMKEQKERLSKMRDEAATQMKLQFDKKLVEKEFAVGGLVWLKKNDRENKLDEFLVGPFRIKKRVGDLDVELEEVEHGPSLGQRPTLQSIRNIDNYLAKEIRREREWLVKDILGHEGKGRGRKYRVLWATGEVTLEPRKSLVDSVNGEETPNEALQKYWERNPTLSRKV